jgi:signal transduction histidine kinase
VAGIVEAIQTISLIKQARETLGGGVSPERSLSDIAALLRKTLHATSAGVIVPNGSASTVATSGVNETDREHLKGMALANGASLSGLLQTWWKGTLISEPVDAPSFLIFAGWRGVRAVGEAQTDTLATLGQFAAISLAQAAEAKAAEIKVLEEERDRIACELHDGLAQSLYGMTLQLKTCRRLIYKNPEAADERLKRLEDLGAIQIEDVRNYMRTLKENHSISPDFTTIIKNHARQFCALNSLKLDFRDAGAIVELNPEIRENLYYVVCEALGNVARHARATGITVEVSYDEAELELQVADDGCGFDVGKLVVHDYSKSGMGLENIKKRVQQLGGIVTIQSRINGGTKILAVVPYSAETRGDRNDVSATG